MKYFQNKGYSVKYDERRLIAMTGVKHFITAKKKEGGSVSGITDMEPLSRLGATEGVRVVKVAGIPASFTVWA